MMILIRPSHLPDPLEADHRKPVTKGFNRQVQLLQELELLTVNTEEHIVSYRLRVGENYMVYVSPCILA